MQSGLAGEATENHRALEMKTILFGFFVVALVAGFTGCKSSQASLQAKAKISRTEAEKTALTKTPGGTVKEGELEKEHGKLVWSFDIATPGTKDITEVQVNAVTGEIVSVENETPAQQEKEKEADKKK